jgi:hypothetical protein
MSNDFKLRDNSGVVIGESLDFIRVNPERNPTWRSTPLLDFRVHSHAVLSSPQAH